MAEVVVHNGNNNIQVVIKYDFSKDTGARTWGLSASLYVRVPANYNIGPWGTYGSNTGNLVGGGIGNISTGDHKLAGPYTTSGSYNNAGNAPSVTITWAWNVNSSWGGCVYPHGSVTVSGDSIGAANYNVGISHWSWGFIHQEGNNGNKDAFHLTDTSFSVAAGSSYVINASRATTIPNGYYLAPRAGSSITGSWTTHNFPATFSSAGNFEYDYYPTSYTITYTMNGGTNNSSNPSSYNVLYGVTFANPTRSGYTFKGWTIGGSAVTGINVGANASFSSASDLYSKLNNRTTGNKTVVATWLANPPWDLIISRTGGSTTTIDVSVGASGYEISNYTVYYRLKGNTGNYTSKSLGTGTTTTLTGLSVDTDYEVYFTVTNPGGTTTSSVVTYSTTLSNPTLTTPVKSKTFPFMTTITATGSITPSRTLTYAFSKDGGATWTAYQSSNLYHWTNLNEKTTYSMGVRVKATHIGTNASDTTATKYISVTTPTNQARARIKKDGLWQKGRVYMKVDDSWKEAKSLYIKVNGQWVENKNFYENEPSLWD